NNHYNNITIDYNTVIQTGYPPGGGSQGFTLDGNANAPLATFDGGSVSNNTIIVTSTPVGATGYAMRFSTDLINGTFTVANNYIDASGLSNGGINYDIRQSIAGGPYHGTIKSFGDVNMVTGAVIAPNGFENNTTAVNPPPSGVGAPTIASFTTDSGVAGDHITNDSTLTLSGSAVANSTVNIFDGGKLLNSVVATASGAWSYTTGTMANGSHSFTATDTVSGVTSAASGALNVTVDTAAPAAPVITGDTIVNTNRVQLTGTAEANSKVTVFDGATALGTATADASGAWSYTTGPLSTGPNAFTATAADVAGNTSAVSQLYDPIVGGTVIEGKGAISLTQVGDQYYLDASTGAIPPTLKISGIDHLANMAGIAGQWTPIAAETTATGYEVAWKGVGTNQYTVMNTDNNGNYVSSIGVVSGNSNALMSLENSFHQDLNGDGHIGVSGTGGTGGTGGTVIESNGATSLTQVGDQYYLYDSKGVGPSLKISGVD